MSHYHSFDQRQSNSTKPAISDMSLRTKLEELIVGSDFKREKTLLDEIYKDISRIKNPRALFSNKYLSVFQRCYSQQYNLPKECWNHFERKIIGFINSTKNFEFFKSKNKQSLILSSFPSQNIKDALLLIP